MKKTMLIAVVVLLLSAGAATAAYFYLGGFDQENEIKRMVQVMSELETVSYDAASTVGGYDVFDDGTEKFSLNLAGSMVKTGEFERDSMHVFDFEPEVGEGLTGEVRVINGATYLKMDSLFGLEEIFTDLADSWIMYAEGEETGLLPTEGGLLDSENELTEEQQQEVEALVARSSFVLVNSANITEIVNGVATRMFEVEPDLVGIRDFAMKSFEITNDEEMSPADLAELDALITSIANLQGTLWIDTKTHYLHRVTVWGPASSPEGDEVNLYIKAEFTNHDDSMSIEVPKNYVGFEELFGAALGDAFGLPEAEEGEFDYFGGDNEVSKGFPEAGSGTSLDSDGDGLPDADEGFYGTDPFDTDSDNDGILDGQEVEDGSNPMGTGHLFQFGLPE